MGMAKYCPSVDCSFVNLFMAHWFAVSMCVLHVPSCFVCPCVEPLFPVRASCDATACRQYSFKEKCFKVDEQAQSGAADPWSSESDNSCHRIV